MKEISPRLATEKELRLFHAEYYVNYLKEQSCDDCDDDDVDDEQLEYGIGYDCPKLNNLWKFATTIAGATITSVESIYSGARIAINWCGGWHHAQRDNAEGFCYVNDICIGIQKLREKFKRVLYIDLDTHHGNGVENAFAFTKRAFTLSFHQYETGFFPNSGSVSECGLGQGRGYTANFPYRSGVSGSLFVDYFNKVANLIFETYKPDICVVQCGGDVLVGDPLGNTNLTPIDMGKCVRTVISWNVPIIFLGGGGYNIPNTSRYWTYLTSIICETPISDDIPDDDNDYFLLYGPGYELNIAAKEISDLNTVEEFESNYRTIKENLIKYDVRDV
ncbi:histone deacetylase 8-like isoform X2 [Bradysia coprophila]|nr:histone deacetylase 8-like isoform X2 [Bradysia coprophila]